MIEAVPHGAGMCLFTLFGGMTVMYGAGDVVGVAHGSHRRESIQVLLTL